MLVSSSHHVPRCAVRSGAAAVELAVLLPLLVFLCVISVDFARIFYFSQTITNCARNGALYASDVYYRQEAPYATLEAATLADAANLNDPSNPPTVSSTSGSDSAGIAYVEVTVQYQFRTLTQFPGVPGAVALRRTVRMALAPSNPTN